MMILPDDPRLLPVRTRKQLLAEGYDDKAIRRAVRAGVLHRLRYGTYVDGVGWGRLDEPARHIVTARGVCLRAQTATVVSHASALPFYDAPTWGFDLTEVHVTRDDRKTGRREAGVRQHRGRMLESDVVQAGDVRVTSPTRLALELITLGNEEAALVALCHLLHHRLTTIDALVARRDDAMDRWPEMLGARVVLSLADERIESPGEARTLYLCWRQGLPKPIPQYVVRDRDGRFIARVDFAWPEHGVFLEFDGKEKYVKHLREGESVVDAVLREKRREERVREVTGWRCIRLTWADLQDPQRTAARIRAMLSGLVA